MARRRFMHCGCMLSSVVVGCVFAVPTAALPPLDAYHLDSGLTPTQVQNQPYSYYVRQCVDTLMQYGTDRYGPVSTPVMMSVIDLRDRMAPQSPLELDEAYRHLRRNQRNPGGSDLWNDQETLGVMYDLAQKTGQSTYATFADNYINYYTTNIVNPSKGLIHWGWHQHYDAYQDVKASIPNSNSHEIHFQKGRWPMLAAVNPLAVANEIGGIWQWHVVNKSTGEVNRHDSGDGQPGCDFIFSGCTFISAFAHEYQRTGSTTWLNRAKLVANYFWNHRNMTTNLVPCAPNLGPDRFDSYCCETVVPGQAAGCLLDAYEQSNDPMFRNQAVAYLKAYARYGYDTATGKWWGSLNVNGTPVGGPRLLNGNDPAEPGEQYYSCYQSRGYVDVWDPYVLAYEQPLDAALTYVRAARMTNDPELVQAARRWADFIGQSLPTGPCETTSWYTRYANDWSSYGTYAEEYGKTIDFFRDMADLTDDAQYLSLARSVADDAVSKLWYNGLFRGHPCKPYYESTDGVGDLLGALMRLDAVQTPEPGTFALLAMAGLCLCGWARRRSKHDPIP